MGEISAGLCSLCQHCKAGACHPESLKCPAILLARLAEVSRILCSIKAGVFCFRKTWGSGKRYPGSFTPQGQTWLRLAVAQVRLLDFSLSESGSSSGSSAAAGAWQQGLCGCLPDGWLSQK